jgi:hypothetical protein
MPLLAPRLVFRRCLLPAGAAMQAAHAGLRALEQASKAGKPTLLIETLDRMPM